MNYFFRNICIMSATITLLTACKDPWAGKMVNRPNINKPPLPQTAAKTEKLTEPPKNEEKKPSETKSESRALRINQQVKTLITNQKFISPELSSDQDIKKAITASENLINLNLLLTPQIEEDVLKANSSISPDQDLENALTEIPAVEEIKSSIKNNFGQQFSNSKFSTLNFKTQAKLDFGTRDNPHSYTPEKNQVLNTFLGKGTHIDLYGSTDILSDKILLSNVMIKAGSEIVNQKGKSTILAEDSGFGFEYISTKVGWNTFAGFVEPFTNTGILYLKYYITKSSDGGYIDLSCNWYFGGKWVKEPKTGKLNFITVSNKATEFIENVGHIKSFDLHVKYTKTDDNSGKVSGKIFNFRTFENESKDELIIPELTVAGIDNQIAEAFSGENP